MYVENLRTSFCSFFLGIQNPDCKKIPYCTVVRSLSVKKVTCCRTDSNTTRDIE
jgi:hypothetical protein